MARHGWYAGPLLKQRGPRLLPAPGDAHARREPAPLRQGPSQLQVQRRGERKEGTENE